MQRRSRVLEKMDIFPFLSSVPVDRSESKSGKFARQMVGLKLEGGLQEGAGVVAQKKFEKGEMLCIVPAHVMMTTATGIRSKVCLQIHVSASALISKPILIGKLVSLVFCPISSPLQFFTVLVGLLISTECFPKHLMAN